MIHDLLKDPVISYGCPMHPDIVSDTPGVCPKCGMTLVLRGQSECMLPGKKEHTYEKHTGHTASAFLRKFFVGLLLSVPIVLYSELPETLLGARMPAFSGMQFLAPVLSSILFFYCGWVFLAGAVREVRAKLPGMMSLISLAIIGMYLYGMYAFFVGGPSTLFLEFAALIMVMLLGQYLGMRSIDAVQRASQELLSLLPDTAEVQVGKTTQTRPLSDLKLNDLVVIKPGGKIPADGVVTEGESQVNEAMIAGESAPVAKRIDSEVVAGTINGNGRLVASITKIGEDTFLAGVMRLVARAQASRSRPQILADNAVPYLIGISVLSAVVAMVTWFLLGMPTSFALERLISVLAATNPYVLVLAAPLVVAISISLASRNGLFIKDRFALELARTIDMVLFDKTGTLTIGEYGVYKIFPFIGESMESGQLDSMTRAEENLIRLAASIDVASEHPVSRAIVRESVKREIALLPIAEFERLSGKGVKATVHGMWVEVGGESLVGADMIEKMPKEVRHELAMLAGKGQTVVYVIADGAPIGAIALADTIRPESKEAIAALKRLGVTPVMVTGDSEEVAEWVAQDVGLEQYFFRVSPHEKVEKIKQFQAKGLRVAMVGDGINDASALMQANVGIAIGAGTNVAIESAGIILAKSDPRDIAKIFKFSRLTYRKMIQNLFWATGYNIVAIPLAAGALYSQGVVLSPALSAAFMSLSTVIVGVNALLLRRGGKIL